MTIICERCGSVIEPDDMYVIVNKDRLRDKQTQHIVCGKCVKEIDANLHTVFDSDLIDQCVSVNRIEVLSDDLQ